ncbi:MAG: PilN domain-containing protein [Acidobacteriota bacterium]
MANINLMSEKKPTKQKKRVASAPEESQAPVILFAAIVAVTLAVLVFWWLHLNGKIAEMDKKIAEAEAEKKRLEAIIKQVQEFQRQKELLEKKINIIGELKARQSGPVHLLDEISSSVPEFLWLTLLKQIGNEIQLRGQATNIIAITNLVGNLEKSAWFKDTELKSTTQIVMGTGGYEFFVTSIFQVPVPKKPAAAEPGADGAAPPPAAPGTVAGAGPAPAPATGETKS